VVVVSQERACSPEGLSSPHHPDDGVLPITRGEPQLHGTLPDHVQLPLGVSASVNVVTSGESSHQASLLDPTQVARVETAEGGCYRGGGTDFCALHGGGV
jgi:hypothetical protein